MDTSKEYIKIKMCEKAEEIQKEWKPQIGDFVAEQYQSGIYVSTIIKKETEFLIRTSLQEGTLHKKDELIWLPRQDQLQEMIKEKGGWSNYGLVAHFYNFIKDLHPDTSMEQLWLAFVMSEKYRKDWFRENWCQRES